MSAPGAGQAGPGGREVSSPGFAPGDHAPAHVGVQAGRLDAKALRRLYSYVSRGMVTRRKAGGSRASLFCASEVEGLARRGRPRRGPSAAPGTELVIETQVTEITGDRLRYRGHDALGLAREHSFEEVASLLWTGSLGEPGGPPLWQATEAAVAVGSAAQAALPADTLPLERLQ